ncbi:MAG: LysE family translocator, partial [Helicobacter sp.]|nr:LysE family translocator [Helicobacter sp.]
ITPFMDKHLKLSILVLLIALTLAFVSVIFIATFFRKFINNTLFRVIDRICGIVFILFGILLFINSYRSLMDFIA